MAENAGKTYAPAECEALKTSKKPKKGPPAWILLPIVLGLLLVPYFFWQGTWFGKRIGSDAQIESWLKEARDAKPGPDGRVPGSIIRHAQHAIEELTKRVHPGGNRRGAPTETGDIKKFYPLVLDLVAHSEPVVRRTVAWLMQFDHKATEFDEALLEMLKDSDCLVRRNAALGLCRREDKIALPVLRSMLEPYQVRAMLAGKVTDLSAAGDPVQQDMEIARILPEGAQGPTIVRAPYGSAIIRLLVSNNAMVEEGTPLVELKPNYDQIKNAIVALAMLGEKEDQVRIKELEASGNREISQIAAEWGRYIQKRLD